MLFFFEGGISIVNGGSSISYTRKYNDLPIRKYVAACCRRNTVLNSIIPSLMSSDDARINPSFFSDCERDPKLIDSISHSCL